MKRPPKSPAIQKARKERYRLTLRWTIAGLSGAFGIFLGGLVYYWIQEMNPPPYRPADWEAEGLTSWWYEFAQRWQLVLASATSGTFGVLLPTLAFLERRKEVATLAWGTGVSVIGISGIALAWDSGLSAWEIALPAFLCSLATNLLLGMEIPPPEEDPLIRKFVPTAIPASPPTGHDANAILSLSHQSTLEEFVDDSMALHFPPGTLTFMSIYKGVGIVLVFLLLHFLLPDDLPQRTLLLGVGAAACVLMNWSRFERRTRLQMAEASQKKLGLSFPVQEDWEMNASGLIHRLQDFETKLSWPNLQSLEEMKDGFHMGFNKEGLAFIPYRAFADVKEQRLWRKRLRIHLVKKSGA